jgi:uncharacterized protein YciI
MQFAVVAYDRPGTAELRTLHYPAHRDHLATATQKGIGILLSGPLLADSNAEPIGSLFVFEAASRDAVDEFLRSDPFHKNGVWDQPRVSGFIKRRG